MTWFPDRDVSRLPAVRSPRSVERQLARTDNEALVYARQIQAIGFVGVVALHEAHGVVSAAAAYAAQDHDFAPLYGSIAQNAVVKMSDTLNEMFR